MRIRLRAIRLLAAAALVAGGLTVVASTPASATTCYGSAKSFTAIDDGNVYRWPASGVAYTTSYCNDINVKPTSTPGVGYARVHTCFYPTSGGWYCNAYRDIATGTWGLAATDVKDGTRFYLEFLSNTSGLVAY